MVCGTEPRRQGRRGRTPNVWFARNAEREAIRRGGEWRRERSGGPNRSPETTIETLIGRRDVACRAASSPQQQTKLKIPEPQKHANFGPRGGRIASCIETVPNGVLPFRVHMPFPASNLAEDAVTAFMREGTGQARIAVFGEIRGSENVSTLRGIGAA